MGYGYILGKENGVEDNKLNDSLTNNLFVIILILGVLIFVIVIIKLVRKGKNV